MSCPTVIHPGHHPSVYILFCCHSPRPSPTSICPVPLSSIQAITHQHMPCVIHPGHHPLVHVQSRCHPPRPSPTPICPVLQSSTQTITHQYRPCSVVIHPGHHPPVYVLFRCYPPRPSWYRLSSYRQYRIYQTRPSHGYDPKLSPWSSRCLRSSSTGRHHCHPPHLQMAVTENVTDQIIGIIIVSDYFQLQTHVTWWFENTFCITSPLWGEPRVDSTRTWTLCHS